VRAPGAEIVVRDGAAASAQRLLQFFRHHPERPIELNVAVYAFNRAGMAAFTFGGTSWQPPLSEGSPGND